MPFLFIRSFVIKLSFVHFYVRIVFSTVSNEFCLHKPRKIQIFSNWLWKLGVLRPFAKQFTDEKNKGVVNRVVEKNKATGGFVNSDSVVTTKAETCSSKKDESDPKKHCDNFRNYDDLIGITTDLGTHIDNGHPHINNGHSHIKEYEVNNVDGNVVVSSLGNHNGVPPCNDNPASYDAENKRAENDGGTIVFSSGDDDEETNEKPLKTMGNNIMGSNNMKGENNIEAHNIEGEIISKTPKVETESIEDGSEVHNIEVYLRFDKNKRGYEILFFNEKPRQKRGGNDVIVGGHAKAQTGWESTKQEISNKNEKDGACVSSSDGSVMPLTAENSPAYNGSKNLSGKTKLGYVLIEEQNESIYKCEAKKIEKTFDRKKTDDDNGKSDQETDKKGDGEKKDEGEKTADDETNGGKQESNIGKQHSNVDAAGSRKADADNYDAEGESFWLLRGLHINEHLRGGGWSKR